MRLVSFLACCAGVLLAGPAFAAPGPSPTVQVVVEFDAGGALQVRSMRDSERPSDSSESRRDPRDRIAEWPEPDGHWTGRPYAQPGAAFSLVVPRSALGTTIPVSVGSTTLPLTVPAVIALGEEPVEPELIEFQISGDPEKRQDVVFLGDGYTELERDQFVADIEASLDHLRSMSPYDRYLPLLNVYGVFLPSPESGADHLEANPQTFAATALDCHFGAFGIDRLVDCNPAYVLYLASFAPGEDVRIVIVNDPAYGGSGGVEYAVATNGPDMGAIVAHEMAHTDGRLADEYDYGYASGGTETELPNCTWDEANLPWAGWIDIASPGVGAFEVCSFSDYYRPTDSECTMNALQDQFCVVCREQLMRRIYRHVDTLLAGSSDGPGATLEPGSSLELWVATLELGGEPVAVSWVRNDGTELGTGPALDVPAAALVDGTNTVTAHIVDSVGFTFFVDDEPAPLDDAVSWTVEVAPGAGGDDDDDAVDDDDDGGGGNACGGNNGDDDDDRGGFSQVGYLLPLMPLLLVRRRRPDED
ncbi:MAG: hypothetical protein GY898_23950 [Proteobacteria bacterium]|nr:hypothetical protein [Pseudomonadota bacterium]